MAYKHLRLNTEAMPPLTTSEVDYLECKNACLDAPVPGPSPHRLCYSFSVNFDERICILFESCDYLIPTTVEDNFVVDNHWHSSHTCCDYYIENKH